MTILPLHPGRDDLLEYLSSFPSSSLGGLRTVSTSWSRNVKVILSSREMSDSLPYSLLGREIEIVGRSQSILPIINLVIVLYTGVL